MQSESLCTGVGVSCTGVGVSCSLVGVGVGSVVGVGVGSKNSQFSPTGGTLIFTFNDFLVESVEVVTIPFDIIIG